MVQSFVAFTRAWRAVGLAAVVSGLVIAWGGHPTGVPVVRAQDKVDFVTQIEPILATHCYECHGTEKGRGKLRLHTRELALKGGATGPLLVPGNSAESYIVARLLGEGDEDQMPLDEDPLSDEQIALIKRWIDEGAEWPAAPGTGAAAGPDFVEHWAYVAPTAPHVPAVSRPDWVRTPIDAFVLARLDREGLAPSEPAARETLLRRVSLDLTGLPPTLAEIDAFVADERPDAYERVVDRLLASPHYGERWARLWLDLARYADTNGFEADNARSNWAWRDWVVRAFNDDMPFDQFTVEQLAGDMLPNPTSAQRVATGFHRNSMLNEEGGVDPDESRYEMLVDRVNTTATVWLGSTLACAQCHNHKYDPFSQKDYFQMMAFFATASYEERPHGAGTIYREPSLDLATPEQEAAREAIQTKLAAAEAALKDDPPDRQRAQAAWEAEMLALDASWTPLKPAHLSATNDVTLRPSADGSIVASGPNPEITVYSVTAPLPAAGVTGLRLEALLDESLPKSGPGRDPYGHFRITGIDIVTGAGHDEAHLSNVTVKSGKADGAAYAFDPAMLTARDGRAYVRKGQAWAIDALREGHRVPHQLVLSFTEPLDLPAGTPVTVRIRHEDGTLGQGLGRFRLSVTTADTPERIVAIPARARAWMQTPPAGRTEQQAAELASQFRAQSPLFADERLAVKELRDALGKLAIPTTLVVEETPSFERPSVPLYDRGNFTSPGAPVYASVPGALSAMDESLPANRLGLARWLVSRDNPLTARVTVNRFWEALFGRGIVETSEDFGTMSSPPSHPDLLDALAVQFMESGWRVKPLLRAMVVSSTYRQRSAVTPDLLQKDPYNRLFARGPRFRLEAEMVRDAALVASGRLAPTLGGPSVFPEQPDGIWDSPYNRARWVESEGEDRYRRSLYTFHKRTAPYPLFTTFDATSREFCTVRRVRTNTPLQALATLNDEGLFELAAALGKRMAAEVQGDTNARLTHGFRLTTGRTPTAQELSRLRHFFEDARAHYTARHESGKDPDTLAWTMVGNVLLNLDEALTKG